MPRWAPRQTRILNIPILHFECGCKVALHDGLIEHLPADCTDDSLPPGNHCIGARLKLIEWQDWHPTERPAAFVRSWHTGESLPTLVASYESRCPMCDETIYPGDHITLSDEDGVWVHAEC